MPLKAYRVPQVGETWRDRDRRCFGRTVLIVEVDEREKVVRYKTGTASYQIPTMLRSKLDRFMRRFTRVEQTAIAS